MSEFDFSDIFGKQWAFTMFVENFFKQGNFILFDDMVRNGETTLPNLSIKFVKV